MSITKQAVRKLEKIVFKDSEAMIIPILSVDVEAFRAEAKRLGKRVMGIPIEINKVIAEKNGIKLWTPQIQDLQEAEKGL